MIGLHWYGSAGAEWHARWLYQAVKSNRTDGFAPIAVKDPNGLHDFSDEVCGDGGPVAQRHGRDQPALAGSTSLGLHSRRPEHVLQILPRIADQTRDPGALDDPGRLLRCFRRHLTQLLDFDILPHGGKICSYAT
jgi:hypothetical protein